jgi:hypothetical protein
MIQQQSFFPNADPKSASVNILSICLLALPLLAAEISSSVQYALMHSLDLHIYSFDRDEYTIPAYYFVTLLAGVFTIFLGFKADSSSLFSRGALLIYAVVLYLLSVILLLLQDDHFVNDDCGSHCDPDTPWGYIIAGIFSGQLSFNLLHIVGRSVLRDSFAARDQIAVQTQVAMLVLPASFLVKLVFGLAIRHDSPTLTLSHVRGVTIPFAAIALLLIGLSVILRPTSDIVRCGKQNLSSMFTTDEFPEFFSTIMPLIVGLLTYGGLDYVVPMRASSYSDSEWIEDFGKGYLALGGLSAVAIVGAFISGTSFGVKTSIAATLFASALFQMMNIFDSEGAKLNLFICSVAFSGIGLGAITGGGWAVITAGLPKEGAGKYIGIIVGITSMLTPIGWSMGASSELSGLAFAIAGILGIAMPPDPVSKDQANYGDVPSSGTTG